MGTRHLIAVHANGEYKIAQYGQWDGYPEGQGVDILKFIRDKEKLQKLKSKLKNCRFYDEEGVDAEFLKSYNENCPTWSIDQDNRTDEQKLWFNTFISRDLGAEILDSVANSEGECLLDNSITFSGDSLFCEWCYVIDFDKSTFEVYHGYNSGELNDNRFASYKVVEEHRGDNQYSPVDLLKSYDLNNLPTDEQFLKDLNEDEDE